MSVSGIGGGTNSAAYQQMMKRTQREEAAQARTAGGEYDQTQYLRELNDRLDANVVAGAWNGKDEYDQASYVRDLNSRLDASVVPGAWDGKSSFGAGGATAMIHPEFLKKMHDNPALGAEYEKKINEWAEIDAGIRERMAAQGNTITSLGMSVDKDGRETYHMAGTYTTGGPGGKQETAKSDDRKTFKEKTEEMLERLEEKRRKEKLEAERVAEKTAAEASYTVDTTA